jgi:alpha-amylase/alpha-mannosidase (GH57 family)
MKKLIGLMNFVLVLSMMLAGCGGGSPTVPTGNEDVLYVNIIWHQHQPLYYKNSDGYYTRPWVRVHATKDYYDMASMVAKYPNVHVTFNFTPVLLRQLDDYINGAKDLYWVLAEIPADQLKDDEKRFILQRFFDVNWKKIIALYPRFQELLDKRGGSDTQAIEAAMQSFTVQDFRDLQVWFNLAWFDPDFLAEEPLKSLVAKGRDFTEEDKVVLFDKAEEIIKGIIPLHKELQDKGQIEVITTPYAHPILPLIVDSNLAKIGNPGVELPPRFMYGQDANAHLTRSVEIYTEKFGKAPVGLWPGEGAVAQTIVPFVINAGYQWMATGEPVLAKSLGIDTFTRDAKETVKEADDLYRPYYVTNSEGEKLAVFFRDGVLSDKIGFTYSGVSGTTAAKDLMNRLENIRTQLKEQGATGPHIVSIILDGENAWENYDNDGKEFFNALYQLLSESNTLKTITPSEYLKLFPEQREIKDLFAGAWFSPNYDTWIGEPEENTAWEYLGKVRADLAKYDIQKIRTAPAEAIAKAQDFMYLAEGSDWFWWYGADQDSGQDSYFDEGFRALL